MLLKDGYQIAQASDGVAAWKELKAHQPDLLLIDWNMPEMNGISFLKSVKADPRFSDRYVIMVTARSDPQAKAEAMNAGADDYLTKPFNNLELLARVRVGLRTRSLQKALADEVRVLHRAVEQSPISIVITDREGSIEYVNRQFSLVTGYSFGEAIGKNPRILKSGEMSSSEYAALWKSITTGHEWRGELHNKKKSGELYWEQAAIAPIKNENGDVSHFLAIKEDITERKRIEEAARKSELQFRLVWERSDDGMRLIDAQGIVVRVNAAFCQMMEKSRDEIEGQPFTVVYADAQQAHILLQHQERFASRTISPHLERELTLWNGSKVWLETTNSFFDVEGQAPLLLSVFRDITERKKVEEELRQSEEQFRLISENVADMITLLNEEGTCLYASRSYLILGHDPSQMTGKDFFTYIHPDDVARVKNGLHFAAETYKTHSVEFRFQKNDGLWCHVESTIGLLVNDAGIRFIAVGRDITDRVRREEERQSLEDQLKQRNQELERMVSDLKQMQGTLVQSEKMASIGQLTAGIAHEINNPLAFVSSNLNRFNEYFDDTLSILKRWQELGRSLDDNPLWQPQLRALKEAEKRADLDFITEDFANLMHHSSEGAQRIKSIVDRLRGFSHLAGTELADANLNDALDDTLTIAWNEVKYKATVKKEYGSLPPVQCNVGELKQVFLNLMVNAAHAIHEKGEIVLRTHEEGESVVIEISDTGSGIAPDNLKKIFDPFFTTKPVGKGTGLGLWISATIIQKHKGTITVESEVGRGTTFTIRLPIRQEGKLSEGLLTEEKT
jgi:PAS domain S-box-containing protein